MAKSGEREKERGGVNDPFSKVFGEISKVLAG